MPLGRGLVGAAAGNNGRAGDTLGLGAAAAAAAEWPASGNNGCAIDTLVLGALLLLYGIGFSEVVPRASLLSSSGGIGGGAGGGTSIPSLGVAAGPVLSAGAAAAYLANKLLILTGPDRIEKMDELGPMHAMHKAKILNFFVFIIFLLGN